MNKVSNFKTLIEILTKRAQIGNSTSIYSFRKDGFKFLLT
jgi:hypothetical protein